MNLNVKGGKVAVGGNGDSPISFTTRPDAARFLAYVLVHAPKARLQNQTLRLEGDRAVCTSCSIFFIALTSDALQTFNEIFKGYEERSGTKLDVTYRSLDSLRAKVAENPHDFDAYLHINWATNGTNGEPDNGLYPEWNPTKVLDTITPK